MTEESLDEQELNDLMSRVARLPREISPPADAWEGIATTITKPSRPIAIAFWQRPGFLAAAGLLLVAGSAITAISIDRMDRVSELAAVSPAPVASGSDARVAFAEFTKRENDYISMSNRLVEMLESDQMQLAPQTIEKLKESIRVIDAAIVEARRALAEDPADTQLMEMLSKSYDQKLDLLKRSTDLGRS